MHWVLAAVFAFDLTAALNEPNLEKRSDVALKNADIALTAARDAYNTGNDEKCRAALEEVRESVNLSYQSLVDSGKNPRGSRYYKRAEQANRQLLRRLDALRQNMSVVDRELVDAVRARVMEVHDKLLTAIMAKKK
jgi:hypothetical protein